MTSPSLGGWGCPDPDCALRPRRLTLLARWASRRLHLLTAAAFCAGPPGPPGACANYEQTQVARKPVPPASGRGSSHGWPGPRDHAQPRHVTSGASAAAPNLHCRAPSPGTSYRGLGPAPAASPGKQGWPRPSPAAGLLPEGIGPSSKGLLETPRCPGRDHRALPACSIGRPDGASSLPPGGRSTASSQPGGPRVRGGQPDPGIPDPRR